MDNMNAFVGSREQDAAIEELEQEIELHEDMLRGLDNNSARSADERDVVQNVLDALKAKLESIKDLSGWRDMEYVGYDNFQTSLESQTPSIDEPSEGADMPHLSGDCSIQTLRPHLSPGSQNSSQFGQHSNRESQFLTLPSRSGGKRPLDINNDACAAAGRENKSRRTTPSPAVTAPTTPSSTTDSFDFDFPDDPVLQQLLGADVREQMRDSCKYEKELHRKREQEKADEEYARMLQEEYNPPQTSLSKHTNLYQSTFDPVSGAIFRSMPPPPRPIIKSETIKSEEVQIDYLPFVGSSSSMPGAFPTKHLPSPVSLSDNDSDIEEISASDFTARKPESKSTEFNFFGEVDQKYPFAPMSSMTIPGAYPAAFTGFGGSSVYNPTGYKPYAFNPAGSNLDVLSVGPDLGSFPFDPTDSLSSLPNYRDSLYSDPAKTEEEIKELLSHIRPDEEIDANSREGTPPQMKLTLMEHQKLGLAWMKKMEEGTNKGGKSLIFCSRSGIRFA